MVVEVSTHNSLELRSTEMFIVLLDQYFRTSFLNLIRLVSLCFHQPTTLNATLWMLKSLANTSFHISLWLPTKSYLYLISLVISLSFCTNCKLDQYFHKTNTNCSDLYFNIFLAIIKTLARNKYLIKSCSYERARPRSRLRRRSVPARAGLKV